MTRVKWFGNVTLGKLGIIYFGDMPLLMNEFKVGVMPRDRKSARNPSNDIRIVVGRKSDVLFARGSFAFAFDSVAR